MTSPASGRRPLVLLLVFLGGAVAGGCVIAFGVIGYLVYRQFAVPPASAERPVAVRVTVTREGAAPEEIEADVTDIVEDAVAGVEGIAAVESRSTQGVSVVTCYVRPGHSLDVAVQDMMNALGAARRRLPPDIDPPVLAKVRPQDAPVAWLTLTSDARLPAELSELATKVLKPRVLAIPQVGGVTFGGLQTCALRVWIDRDRLRAHGIDAADVVAVLRDPEAQLPAGILGARGTEELGQRVVASHAGRPVFLRDVALVEDGVRERRSFARFNGAPAVMLGVAAAWDARPADVCAGVRAELPRLRQVLPPGVELELTTGEGAPGCTLVIDVLGPSGVAGELEAVLTRAEAALAELKDPVSGEARFASVLVLSEPGTMTDGAVLFARLAADRPALAEDRAAVRQALAGVPGIHAALRDPSPPRHAGARGYGMTLHLQGPDLGRLRELATRLEAALRDEPAVTDVLAEDRPPVPRIEFAVDREKAARFGIPARRLADTVSLAAGELSLGRRGERPCEVRLGLPREPGRGGEPLEGVHVRADGGQLVPLAAVVAVRAVAAPPALHRFNRLRTTTLTANVADGTRRADAEALCRDHAVRLAREIGLPPGYRLVLLGEEASTTDLAKGS